MIKFTFLEVRKSPKQGLKYRGPFRILEKINNLNYKIKLILNNKETEDIVHKRCLKLYVLRKQLKGLNTDPVT